MFRLGSGDSGGGFGLRLALLHSYQPNARYDDESGQTKVFRAIRDIARGEEIVVNYNGEPEDETPVWFKLVESESSQQEPQCPEAEPCCNDTTANGQPHRNLSLVDFDLPAQGETDGMD